MDDILDEVRVCKHNKNKEINDEIVYMQQQSLPIQGKRYKKNQGWICVSIHGTPYQRGFAHGYLLHKKLQTVQSIFKFLINYDLHVSYTTYLSDCSRIITPLICKDYPEIYHELQGIIAGYTTKGHKMTLDELVAWNSMCSMYTHYRPTSKDDRCSAFIACGDATEKGDVVMAHNSHADYVFARVSNIILTIKPDKGHTFKMQCCPGYVASGMDWFVTSKGIIGCETTIGGFLKKPDFKKGTPYFCRIREAMQYGNNLDDYARIMTTKNAGDYPCSWLFGDIHNPKIMLCELGLKYTHVDTKTNGIFYGMNSAINEKIRKEETNDKTYWDTSKTSGARNVHLHVLLYETYQNKLNVENAKKIIADHYDVFLDRNTKGNSRTLCKHSENDTPKTTNRYPRPFGAIDGKVINTAMAKQMSFYAIYGSSCGQPKKLTRKKFPNHKKTRKISPFLRNIRSYRWTKLKN